MKKPIITYGTFDMFHMGQLRLLQRLKSLGDEWKGKFDFLKKILNNKYS